MASRTVEPKITRFPLLGGASRFSHGKGGYVWDEKNNAYIDFICGMGPVVLGHAMENFNQSIWKAMAGGVILPGYSSHHEAYLDKLLTGERFERAAFLKTGSESVTASLRLAAANTKRLGVVRCGFSGWHDAQAGRSPKWHEPLNSPLRSGLKNVDCIRGIRNDESVYNWLDMKPESLYELLLRHGEHIGAFVLDAYLSSYVSWGVIEEAVEICRRFNITVICDETKTGGRVSKLGLAVSHNLDVDLIVIGKALANGLPMSLVIGKSPLLDLAEKHRLSGTYSKEMIAVQAARATLDHMLESDGFRRLQTVGSRVVSTFNQASEASGTTSLVNGRAVFGGSMFDIDFASEILGDNRSRELLCECLARNGILLLQGHPSFVCLAHENIDFEVLRQSFCSALEKWKKILGYRGSVS